MHLEAHNTPACNEELLREKLMELYERVSLYNHLCLSLHALLAAAQRPAGRMQGVRVLKIAGGKIQLTMKSEEDRRDEAELADRGVGAGSTRKARNTLEAALAGMGFKRTPSEETPKVSTALPPAVTTAHAGILACWVQSTL